MDDDRARAIYSLALDQSAELDRPELIWKASIDFEFENGDYDRVRELYEQLLEHTEHHLKVWVSYATMEAGLQHVQDDGDGHSMNRARAILKRAHDHFKQSAANTERLVLLEAWRELELLHGSTEEAQKVQARLPRRIKKRRQVGTDDAGAILWEEFYDYVFPEDEESASMQTRGHLKLLELARQWKDKKGQE